MDTDRARIWPVDVTLPGQQAPVRAGLWSLEPRSDGWCCRVMFTVWAGDPPAATRIPMLVPGSAVSRLPGLNYDDVPTWRPGEGCVAEVLDGVRLVHHRDCPTAHERWQQTRPVVEPEGAAARDLAEGRAVRCEDCQPDPEPFEIRPVPGEDG